jgi:hypothetical protein
MAARGFTWHKREGEPILGFAPAIDGPRGGARKTAAQLVLSRRILHSLHMPFIITLPDMAEGEGSSWALWN